jgi:hypothetical protein
MLPTGSTLAAVAALLGCVAIGCAPPAKKAASSTQKPIETRKTIGKTTQNVMPLADALQQGGQPAEMSITGGGLGAITSDAYRTSVGKIGIMAVEHQMQLVEAEHGPKPMTHDEFMTKVIGKGRPDGIQLPMLPYYQEWAYDPDTKKLVVVEFPLRKEQRQQETTGASGL